MTSPEKPERKMYNEALKQRFADSSPYSKSTKQQLLKLFRALAEYEEKYAVDFSRMDVDQTREAVSAICGFRANSANAVFFMLREYVKWCRAQGMEVSDAMWNVKLDIVEKMRSAFVGSPGHLKMSLDAAFPNYEENEVQYVYRSFLWLAYMGLSDSEAIQITTDQVDFEAMKVFFDNRSFPIYTEALNDFHKVCELTSFREPRGKSGIEKERVEGNAILRGKKSGKSKAMPDYLITTLRPMVSRAFGAALAAYEEHASPVPQSLSLELTYKHIYLSGIFYRMYEGERIGIKPKFDEIVIRERIGTTPPRFDKNYTYNKLINTYIRGYEADYLNWKSLFA